LGNFRFNATRSVPIIYEAVWLNSGTRDRREDVLQVHSKHNTLAYMRSRKRPDGSSLAESVHRRMKRNFIQKQTQNLPLQLFQLRFGRFDQAKVAGPLCEDAVVIVP
jgi:hypothetical protein